jgi:hypothetical protein
MAFQGSAPSSEQDGRNGRTLGERGVMESRRSRPALLYLSPYLCRKCPLRPDVPIVLRHTKPTPCSASLASKRWPPQPAVVLTLRHSGRSYVETGRWRRGPLWLPPWFQASGSRASRRPLWAKPSGHGDGNNC